MKKNVVITITVLVVIFSAFALGVATRFSLETLVLFMAISLPIIFFSSLFIRLIAALIRSIKGSNKN
ncbi:MAG: hypothetical protein ACYTDW_22670 [Planctomycetota bacterium]|jgi:ABC-type multidrug transport system permease subunit